MEGEGEDFWTMETGKGFLFTCSSSTCLRTAHALCVWYPLDKGPRCRSGPAQEAAWGRVSSAGT